MHDKGFRSLKNNNLTRRSMAAEERMGASLERLVSG
tara:strand:- start:136 stop:243 length:108 start_codon:yes stop_codon:yes gene_type:complete